MYLFTKVNYVNQHTLNTVDVIGFNCDDEGSEDVSKFLFNSLGSSLSQSSVILTVFVEFVVEFSGESSEIFGEDSCWIKNK